MMTVWMLLLNTAMAAESSFCADLGQMVEIKVPADAILATVIEGSQRFSTEDVVCVRETGLPPELVAAVAAREETATQREERLALASMAQLRQDDSPAGAQAKFAFVQEVVARTTAGAWTITTKQSPMDDSVQVALSVTADNLVDGWLEEARRPVLMVRCQERRFDIYVVSGLAPHPEAGIYDGAHVRLRIDKDPARSVVASESTSSDALFLPSAETEVQRLIGHDKLLFEFTPYHSSPVLVSFPITGLDVALRPLAVACALDGYPPPVQ